MDPQDRSLEEPGDNSIHPSRVPAGRRGPVTRTHPSSRARTLALLRPAILIGFVASLLCARNVAAQPAAVVVAIGASNTSGFGVGEAAAYPARLEEILRACGYAVRVVNAGVSFETTNGMLERIDRDVPDGTRAVVIQPGGNDRRFFVSGKRRAANIEAMKARLAARRIPALVYDPAFPPDAYQWDGIHLTAARHALIARELAPSIAALVGAASGRRGASCPSG